MQDWQLIGPWAPGVEWFVEAAPHASWLHAYFPDGVWNAHLFEATNPSSMWAFAEQASVQLVAEWL